MFESFRKRKKGNEGSAETMEKKRLQDERRRTDAGSLPTDNTLTVYRRDLQFVPESFRGKTILDLGSGEQEIFSKEMEKYGATVISLNPKLKEQESRDLLVSRPGWQERSVASRGQELPFKKESFDAVLARWSVSHYLRENELVLAIEQAYEVLKPGGIILLTPTGGITPAVIDKLKSRGIYVLPHGTHWPHSDDNSVEISKPLK